ncbi:MAG: hypothetical protein M1511_08570 [Deltaproteobacteria bacterium]|nr:hypothetical protein [Deltaproteobacteria bacterium]
MTKKILGNREPSGTPTTTNRDITTIIIGIALTLLFAMITYFSINSEGHGPGAKPKGPVKNPHSFLHDTGPESGIIEKSFSKIHKASDYCLVRQDFFRIM